MLQKNERKVYFAVYKISARLHIVLYIVLPRVTI